MTVNSYFKKGIIGLSTMLLVATFTSSIIMAVLSLKDLTKGDKKTMIKESSNQLASNQKSHSKTLIVSNSIVKSANFSSSRPVVQTYDNKSLLNGKVINKMHVNSKDQLSANTNNHSNTQPNQDNENTRLSSLSDEGIVVEKTYVNVSLFKDMAVDGLIYGEGFAIFSKGATGWQIKYNEPTSGQGFYDSSGGIIPNGSVNIRTYINPSKSNGIYTGSAVIQYFTNGVWSDGPTVYYNITLIGPMESAQPTPTPIPTSEPSPLPTVTPSSTPSSCNSPITFSERKSNNLITVSISGAWWLSVKSTPQYASVDFDESQKIVYLHFTVSSGTVFIYQASYDGAPLCQSYQFGNK